MLAIAALIFLMVFIALPALQRSQRDDSRKKDMTIISSDLASWQGDNSTTTTLPTQAKLLSYGATSANTTTVDLGSTVTGNKVAAVDGTVGVYQGYKCGAVTTGDATTMTLTPGAKRQFAIVTLLEGGGGTAFCLDS